MGEPIKRKMFEVTQNLPFLTWEYTKENMLKRIKNISGVTRYSFILHDKDLHADGSKVAPHFDLVICFDNSHTLDSVAKAFEVPSQQVSIVKGTRSDAEAYLTHLNAPEKHQYSPDEVTASFDYKSFYEKVKADKAHKNSLENILVKIDNQEIKPYNIQNYIGVVDYAKYKQKIDTAFTYVQLKMGVNRDMICVYLWGNTGVGKTTLAKFIAEKKGYKTFVSSGGKHPLDDYKGQECIILDDIRQDTFHFNDFLKLTDNNTDSLVGCRYYNKSISYCKMIICTSVIPIQRLFSDYEAEDQHQVFRRFARGGIYEVTQTTITPFAYNAITRQFVQGVTYGNPVPAWFEAENKPFTDTLKDLLNCAIPRAPENKLEPQKQDNGDDLLATVPF